MKKLITVILSIMVCISLYAQKDVTKFLGFPVDGSKSELIKNLKTKGFRLITVGDTDMLTGRFNGSDVHVYISTENGKVSRVMVCDENCVGETDIKIRFNRLCRQFMNNGKYLSLNDYTISDDEDISYEMAVRNKRYEAIFYQLPEGAELEALQTSILQKAQPKYSQEQLENPTDDLKAQLFAECTTDLLQSVRNKPVWFMISEYHGKFYITMFYDNEYNRAQGEDL